MIKVQETYQPFEARYIVHIRDKQPSLTIFSKYLSYFILIAAFVVKTRVTP